MSTFPFSLEVPYKLVETTEDKPKPLIVYLHGYKQNLKLFERKVTSILALDAHHLLLQGPYPIYDKKRNVENWGRAWYLYDGRQRPFKKSLEKSSNFIDEILEKVSDEITYSSITVLGYSMGGYLAGYYALSRSGMVDNLIIIGGRIKAEWFAGNNYENLNVLSLHGSLDESVQVSPAEKSSLELDKMGASITFKTMGEGHRLNEVYVKEAKKWLKKQSAFSEQPSATKN